MFDTLTRLCPQDSMQSFITMPSKRLAFKFSSTCVRAAFIAECPHMGVPVKIPIFNFMTSLHTYMVSCKEVKMQHIIHHGQQKQSIPDNNKPFLDNYYLFDKGNKILKST